MRLIVLLALSVLGAVVACDRDDDRDTHLNSGATPKEDVVGWGADTPEVPAAPDFDDDDAIRAWGEDALHACGAITSTVPAGWEMILIGDTGCTVHRPPSWTFEVEGASVWIYASPQEEAGVMLLNGVLEGTTWTAEAILDGIVDTLREQYPDITIIDAGEAPDPHGLGLVIRIASLKFHDGAVPMVGMLRVIHSPCSELLGTCPLTAAGTWAPLATLPDFACTLSQIDATVTCPKPGGGSCDAGDCDAGCKAEGSAYGYCSNDTCVCAG